MNDQAKRKENKCFFSVPHRHNVDHKRINAINLQRRSNFDESSNGFTNSER